jgi:hypothetical protein
MRTILALLVAGCSSTPSEPPTRTLTLGVQSVGHVTDFNTEIITAASGKLQVSGGECAGECSISVGWSDIALADFVIGGHTVQGATVALDDRADGATFDDGTYLINPSGVTATLVWTLDGNSASTSLQATAPLAGGGAPTGTPSVIGDFQGGSIQVHLTLSTM